MCFSEEEVYQGTKRFFKNNNFLVLAGQPPRGVDHLPVIEIKDESFLQKGSKNSYKPDLLTYKDNLFYIVECKPTFDSNDYVKLKSILESTSRLNMLYDELKQRNILTKYNICLTKDEFSKACTGVLAYSSEIVYNDLFFIRINHWRKGYADHNIN